MSQVTAPRQPFQDELAEFGLPATPGAGERYAILARSPQNVREPEQVVARVAVILSAASCPSAETKKLHPLGKTGEPAEVEITGCFGSAFCPTTIADGARCCYGIAKQFPAPRASLLVRLDLVQRLG